MREIGLANFAWLIQQEFQHDPELWWLVPMSMAALIFVIEWEARIRAWYWRTVKRWEAEANVYEYEDIPWREWDQAAVDYDCYRIDANVVFGEWNEPRFQ